MPRFKLGTRRFLVNPSTGRFSTCDECCVGGGGRRCDQPRSPYDLFQSCTAIDPDVGPCQPPPQYLYVCVYLRDNAPVPGPGQGLIAKIGGVCYTDTALGVTFLEDVPENAVVISNPDQLIWVVAESCSDPAAGCQSQSLFIRAIPCSCNPPGAPEAYVCSIGLDRCVTFWIGDNPKYCYTVYPQSSGVNPASIPPNAIVIGAATAILNDQRRCCSCCAPETCGGDLTYTLIRNCDPLLPDGSFPVETQQYCCSNTGVAISSMTFSGQWFAGSNYDVGPNIVEGRVDWYCIVTEVNGQLVYQTSCTGYIIRSGPVYGPLSQFITLGGPGGSCPPFFNVCGCIGSSTYTDAAIFLGGFAINTGGLPDITSSQCDGNLVAGYGPRGISARFRGYSEDGNTGFRFSEFLASGSWSWSGSGPCSGGCGNTGSPGNPGDPNPGGGPTGARPAGNGCSGCGGGGGIGVGKEWSFNGGGTN